MAFLLHDPDDTVRYSFDWSNWGTLASASFSVSPSGPTVVDIGDVGNVATASIYGVVFGKTYSLTCEATLSSGEVVSQSTAIICSDK